MKQDTQARFEALRRRALELAAIYSVLAQRAEAQYGPNALCYGTAPRGVRVKADKARDRAWAAEAAFFAYLNSISPRNWQTRIPAQWILRNLSYADAMTAGPLSVVPPVGYGSTPMQVRAFVAAPC